MCIGARRNHHPAAVGSPARTPADSARPRNQRGRRGSARRTRRAATIHPRLATILHEVRAARGLTNVARAHQVDAVEEEDAALARGAGDAIGAPAILPGLQTVHFAVVALWDVAARVTGRAARALTVLARGFVDDPIATLHGATVRVAIRGVDGTRVASLRRCVDDE